MSRLVDPVTLRLFVAVCDTGSIARAAEREALVASAVSKRIAAIERRLGTPVLVRGRRGVVPTAAGHALLRQSREVLGALDRLQAELDGFAIGVQGSLRIAASVSAIAEDLPDDVAAFLDAYPRVRVSIDERGSREVVREVRAGAADVGIAWDEVDASGLRALPYRADHLHVVMPASHPLAARASLRFADTLDFPSVGVATAGLVGARMQREAALLGRTLVHRMQVSSLDACLRIVAAGLGLAILPRETSGGSAGASRLVMRPLDEPWSERRFAVLTRDEATLPAAARRLAECLAACARPARESSAPGRARRA
jgi:DNA-binding transcriptional LysR family regulator